MNFTQMVTLFASKMAGGSDDDDVILASFEAFEIDGKIDADAFRHSLMTFGVKFSASEVDDAFAEMKIDEGMIDESTSRRHTRLSTTSSISRLKKCVNMSQLSSAPVAKCASKCPSSAASLFPMKFVSTSP